MKLYVIPVEESCNATCAVCITDFKENKFGSTLDISALRKIESLNIDKIEITGGGEPFLHPKIATVVSTCSQKAPTQIYTNGSMLHKYADQDFLKRLLYLCISRFHHDATRNFELMGVEQKVAISELATKGIAIKLSLVLQRSGIYTAHGVREYLDWANEQGARKVVVRQIFDYDPATTNTAYCDLISREHVSSHQIFKDLGIEQFTLSEQGNPIFRHKNLEVEVEYRSCACEMHFPMLRGDGNLYYGWTTTPWTHEKSEVKDGMADRKGS